LPTLPDKLVVGLRRKAGEGNLALSHDIIDLITAAPDLVLRLAIDQLRHKAGYLVDATRAVIKPVNPDKITNLVPMLNHTRPTNIR
jgi:hypothetical protein